MEGEGQCAHLVLPAKCNKMACTKAKRGDYSSVVGIAGWSSPVARQAHNLKAAGSNPAPATNFRAQSGRIQAIASAVHFLPDFLPQPMASYNEAQNVATRWRRNWVRIDKRMMVPCVQPTASIGSGKDRALVYRAFVPARGKRKWPVRRTSQAMVSSLLGPKLTAGRRHW